MELLERLERAVLFPAHPRTRARLAAAMPTDRLAAADGVQVAAPLGYLEFTALLCHAGYVLTDSGGVQKETYLAGVPCVTLRATTEWVETIETGWNTLVDLDVNRALAVAAREVSPRAPALYGDGRAGERMGPRWRGGAAPPIRGG